MSWPPSLLAALFLTTSCLPESGPGLGRRLLEGRGLATLGAAPADAAGPAEVGPLFFSRSIPGAEAGGSSWSTRSLGARDLFVLRPGSSQAELLISHYSADHPLRFDARGRLVVVSLPVPRDSRERVRLTIVDLAAGSRIDLGLVRTFALSPGGTQLYYQGADEKLVVRTSQDVERRLPGPHSTSTFVGETLYASDAGSLWRVDPDGSEPLPIAPNVTRHHPIVAAGQPLAFVLVSGSGACTPSEARYFRPDDPGATTPLGQVIDPFAVRIAPDGGRIVLFEPRPGAQEAPLRVMTIEPRSDRQYSVPIPPGGVGGLGEPPRPETISCPRSLRNVLTVAFRPQSDEIWALSQGGLSILGAGGEMESLTGPFRSFSRLQRPLGQTISFLHGGEADLSFDEEDPFSSDGRRWAFREWGGRVRIADAGPPRTTSVLPEMKGVEIRSVAELPGTGSALLFVSTGQGIDLQLYDAALSVRRKTIRDVRHIAFSQRRLLTIDHGASRDELYSPGTLALLELETEAQIPIAPNVTEFLPLTRCGGCDPLGPGAPLAYLVHARVPWKYDGLWTAALP